MGTQRQRKQLYSVRLPGGESLSRHPEDGTFCIHTDAETFNFEVLSDVHFDSQYCHRKFLRQRLDACAQDARPFILLGDFVDAMCGRKDPRGDKEMIRQEYLKGNYWQAVAKDAANELRPYRDLLACYLLGNHETAPMKHNEINMQQMILEYLFDNDTERVNLVTGDYESFMQVRMTTEKGVPSQHTQNYNIWLYHGSGGNSPVTKGAIQRQRKKVHRHGFDLYLQGHIHQEGGDTDQIEMLGRSGRVIQKTIHSHHIPCLKDERGKRTGWAVEKGYMSGPIGSYEFRLKSISYRQGLRRGDAVDMQHVVHRAYDVAKKGYICPPHETDHYAFSDNA